MPVAYYLLLDGVSLIKHRCLCYLFVVMKFKKNKIMLSILHLLTLSNPVFLPTAYSPALICFGRERGWWITCNYPTVLKEETIEKQKEYNLLSLLAKACTT